ncbi:hypothetical protein S40285_01935 [Stachybotrys chlorohalonatus IBT 40285]|uniref:PinX1-related protein 1 n=1 Tax=Stachybotrys chlorohalonatus (strain IBT 40285) TaxID=1283841 RepID=A0A084QQS0_STAC4|nr:hypothetical protein S40285_01935 [Stachybotrys chlorohalonata IBT 40285]
MGLLAESKTRKVTSKDPNNTKWMRDTSTFGQKILRAQGWQPGQYLGVQDAPHSEFHTAANASFIKVALKDDMKGLGFDKAKDDEITGINVFSDLLSRLNGKSEVEVEEQRQARLTVKACHYVDSKYGPMRFVRGGLLVGDELKETKPADEPALVAVNNTTEEPKSTKKDKKSKKRKATDMEPEDSEAPESAPSEEDRAERKKRRKEERRAKKSRSTSTSLLDDSSAAIDEGKAKKRDKKKKKSNDGRRAEDEDEDEDNDVEATERAEGEKDGVFDEVTKDEAKRLKKERKEREKKEKKEKKERKKEKKRKREEAASVSISVTTTSDVTISSSAHESDKLEAPTATATSTGTSTPIGSRNFVRSRFIASKRQATLDAKALNQVKQPPPPPSPNHLHLLLEDKELANDALVLDSHDTGDIALEFVFVVH